MVLAPGIIILIKEGSVPKLEQNWLNTLVCITAAFDQGFSLAAGRGGGSCGVWKGLYPFFPGHGTGE